MRWFFPPLKNSQDADSLFALVAKAAFVFGLIVFLWGLFWLYRWMDSSRYVPTLGFLRYGDYEKITSGYSNATLEYALDGKNYVTPSLTFGGRPFCVIPPEGPVTIYYDPDEPSHAVLWRRPSELVFLALAFGLAFPFVARYIWTHYV
jgi:hypothetical protein